jgi:hypothetical protein
MSNNSLTYYNPEMRNVPYSTKFTLKWESLFPGDNGQITQTYGQPVLPVSDASANTQIPTQEEIDDFLGIAGDIPARYVKKYVDVNDPGTMANNSLGVIVNMGGQVRPGRFLAGGVMGICRITGYNEQAAQSEGQSYKTTTIVSDAPIDLDNFTNCCYVSPAGNVLMIFQYGTVTAGITQTDCTWGSSGIQLQALSTGWIDIDMKWFPK